MTTLVFPTMNRAYWGMYQHVRQTGTVFTHRGADCMEVRPFMMKITRPELSLFTGIPRRMNYRFWVAETLGYIAGWGTYMGREYAELLTKLNSNYRNFTDHNSGELFGMVKYGDGFRYGLPRAFDTLKQNPDRRQAFIPIWERHTEHSYQESPCMVGMQFFTEKRNILSTDGGDAQQIYVLSAMVNIRSNDLNWGVPYDIAAMCAIQIAMANALDIRIGSYWHVAVSMHYYLNGNNGEGPPNINNPDHEAYLPNPPRMPTSFAGDDIRFTQALAHKLLLDMHDHFVVKERKAYKFQSDHEGSDWVKQWCDILRWNWPDAKA